MHGSLLIETNLWRVYEWHAKTPPRVLHFRPNPQKVPSCHGLNETFPVWRCGETAGLVPGWRVPKCFLFMLDWLLKYGLYFFIRCITGTMGRYFNGLSFQGRSFICSLSYADGWSLERPSLFSYGLLRRVLATRDICHSWLPFISVRSSLKEYLTKWRWILILESVKAAMLCLVAAVIRIQNYLLRYVSFVRKRSMTSSITIYAYIIFIPEVFWCQELLSVNNL